MTATTIRPMFIATTILVVVLATTLWLRWRDTTPVLAVGQDKTVHEVKEGDSLHNIAAQYGVSVEDLVAANPDYPGYLYKSQKLTIPARNSRAGGMSIVNEATPTATEDRAASEPPTTESTNTDDSSATEVTVSEETVAEVTATPDMVASDAVASDVASSEMPVSESSTYEVQEGDSLLNIATRYGVTVGAIFAANPDLPGYLYVGQVLTIPTPPHTSSDVVETPLTESLTETIDATTEDETTSEPAGGDATDDSVSMGEPVEEQAEAPAPSDATPQADIDTEQAASDMASSDIVAPATITYEVEEGDSLRRIANRYGVTVEAIIGANPNYSGYLYKGQKLTIPPASDMSTAEEAPAGTSDVADTATDTALVTDTGADMVDVSSDTSTLAPITHEVEEGDSLLLIARRYGISVIAIIAANPNFPGYLYKSQQLIIPSENDISQIPSDTDASGNGAMGTDGDADMDAADDTASTEQETAATAESAGEPDSSIAEEEAAATESEAEMPVVEPEDSEAGPAEDETAADSVSEDEPAATPTESEVSTTEGGETAGEEMTSDAVVEEAAAESDAEEITPEDSTAGEESAAETEVTQEEPATVPSAADESSTTQEQAAAEDDALEEDLTEDGMADEEVVEETVDVVVSAPAAIDPSAAWASPQGQAEVFSPVSGGAYHSPIEIIGLSSTTGGAIHLELVTDDGEVIAVRSAEGGSSDEYAFFHSYLRFNVQEGTPATLYVYGGEQASGAPGTVAEIPLILMPGQRIIDITYPTPGAAVCEDVEVEGYSNTFEANVVVELRHQSDAMAGQVAAMGGNLGVYRDFSTTFQEPVTEPAAILTSAYATDASGRYPHIDNTIVPITVYPAGSAYCPN